MYYMADRKDTAIVRVTPKTRKELKLLRDQMDLKSYEELFDYLLDLYESVKKEEK